MLAATMVEAGRARKWAVQCGRLAGLTEHDLFALEMVVGEALTNVVRHAYGDEPSDHAGDDIRLTLHIDASRLAIVVRDWGRKFEMPMDAGVIDLDEPRTQGYGLYILKELMDDVTADTSYDDGTELRMERRLGTRSG